MPLVSPFDVVNLQLIKSAAIFRTVMHSTLYHNALLRIELALDSEDAALHPNLEFWFMIYDSTHREPYVSDNIGFDVVRVEFRNPVYQLRALLRRNTAAPRIDGR